MTFTLVTSFLNYYHTPLTSKTLKLRFSRLRVLLDIELPIVIYVSPDLVGALETYVSALRTRGHIRMVPLKKPIFESSYAYLIANQLQLGLPEKRLIPKDTLEYICYLHSKIGFIHHVSSLNPFQTNHFIWMDFDISTMWERVRDIQLFLRHLFAHEIQRVTAIPPTEKEGSKPVSTSSELFVPSCWAYEKRDLQTLCDRVCWRFCTNFFVGTSESIQHLYYLYTEYYQPFLSEQKKMTWDMNFWAYLEQEKGWNPISYTANHDDTMVLHFPLFALSERMHSRFLDTHIYSYPRMKGFHPSSASCISYMDSNGEIQQVMNVRYVNYTYLPSGHCTHPSRIQTRNLCGIMGTEDASGTIGAEGADSFLSFQLVDESASSMGLSEPDPNEMFQGMEDIRLFVWKHRLMFTATTVNFSGCAQNRIVYGEYHCAVTSPPCSPPALRNVRILESPNQCKEKNWIPFVSRQDPDQLYFIYSWSPFRMGVVDTEKDGNAALQMKYIHRVRFPYQEQIRGSSNVVYFKGEYVALVHISVEKTLPKQYYHMLVWFSEENYKPVRFSKLCYFQEWGVEFCLCMAVKNDTFIFWPSMQDNDAVCLTVPCGFFCQTFPVY